MSKEKILTFKLLKAIGYILSAIPFIVNMVCIVIILLLNLIRNITDKMIDAFMFPSIKYYYKHNYGKEITFDQLSRNQ